MDTEASDAINAVVQALANSTRVLFITGAGVSADSGLPTYRGIGGLYDASHPEEGIPIEEILSGRMLRHRPELTWKYLAMFLSLYCSADRDGSSPWMVNRGDQSRYHASILARGHSDPAGGCHRVGLHLEAVVGLSASNRSARDPARNQNSAKVGFCNRQAPTLWRSQS